MAPAAARDRPKFRAGARVAVAHGGVYYDAKVGGAGGEARPAARGGPTTRPTRPLPPFLTLQIVKVEQRDAGFHYLVHYAGWSKAHDEWAGEEEVKKFSDALVGAKRAGGRAPPSALLPLPPSLSAAWRL